MITNSEKEDVMNEIKSKGLDVSDFELIDQEDLMQGTDIQPITGLVTIKRKSTGTSRSYASGDRSTWPTQFADDLKRGLFK
jgi:hypothetical protein